MNRFNAKSSKASRESKRSVNHTKGELVIVDFSWIENRDLKSLLNNFSYSGVNNMSSPHIVCLQIETAFMQSSFSFSCINCKRLFYVARQLYFSFQLILLFNQQKIKGAGNEKKICPKNACIVPSKVHPIFQCTSIYPTLRIFDQGVRYCTHCVRLYRS